MAGRFHLAVGFSAAALLVGILGIVSPAPAAAATPVRDINRFACAPGLTTPFGDVAGTTHERAIACALHYELTGGTTPTTFSPGAPVTRGQMATFLIRLLGIGDVGPGDVPSAGFTDTAGSPHAGNIDALVELGIAQGTSPTTYSPDAPVSRAQMARFLDRTATHQGFGGVADAPDAFTDDEGSPHEPAIDRMAGAGIASGITATTFGPSQPVTRGAMASFLVRLIDLGIEIGFYNPQVATEAFAALAGPSGKVGTAVVFTTDVPGVVCSEIILEGLDPTTGARVEIGDGVTLVRPQPNGFTRGCVSDPDAAALATDPGSATVRVTTQAFPGGAVSGPLGEMGSGGIADLEDLQVVPGPGSERGFGIAAVFATSQPGVLCASVGVLVPPPDAPTAVHLHRGAPHTNGDVVLELGPIESFGIPVVCRNTEAAAELVANPRAFYVDVHSASFPNGALRGQLTPSGG